MKKTPSDYFPLVKSPENHFLYEGYIKKHLLDNWDLNDLFLNNVKDGKLFLVKKMLGDFRINPTYCNNEAIVLSVLYEHYSIFDLLFLDERIDPSDQNNLPFLIAIQKNNLIFQEKLKTHPKVIHTIIGI